LDLSVNEEAVIRAALQQDNAATAFWLHRSKVKLSRQLAPTEPRTAAALRDVPVKTETATPWEVQRSACRPGGWQRRRREKAAQEADQPEWD
jgi:hypothetical protein